MSSEAPEYLYCSRPGCNATHPLGKGALSLAVTDWMMARHPDGYVCFYCPDCAVSTTAEEDPPLDVLAEAQGIKPFGDANALLGEWRDNPYTGRSDLTVRDYPQGLIVLTVRYSDGEYCWELWVGADGHSASLGSGALTAQTPHAAKAEAVTRACEWAGWLTEQLTGTGDEA